MQCRNRCTGSTSRSGGQSTSVPRVRRADGQLSRGWTRWGDLVLVTLAILPVLVQLPLQLLELDERRVEQGYLEVLTTGRSPVVGSVLSATQLLLSLTLWVSVYVAGGRCNHARSCGRQGCTGWPGCLPRYARAWGVALVVALQLLLMRHPDPLRVVLDVLVVGSWSLYLARLELRTVPCDSVHRAASHRTCSWSRLCLVLVLLTILNGALLYVAMLGQSPRRFTRAQLHAMNEHVPYANELSSGRTGPVGTVVMVVVDGLGWNDVQGSPDWQALQNDYPDDVLVMESAGQLPSVSLPNWLTLVSGAAPENHGVYGNVMVPDTPVDTIFSRLTSRRDLPPAMLPPESRWYPPGVNGTRRRSEEPEGARACLVGSTFWTDLVGIGEVGNEVELYPVPIGWSDPAIGALETGTGHLGIDADLQRARLARRLLRRTGPDACRFLLLHLGSLDHTAHLLGKHDQRYREAVRRQAAIVRSVLGLVRTMGNDTLLMVTSDHGHVMSGGHGGSDPSLRRVPLLLHHPGIRGVATIPRGPVDSRDLAPTITALLGASAPRQAEGNWVDALEHLVDASQRPLLLLDLLAQRRTWLQGYLVQIGLTAMDRRALVDRYPDLRATDPRTERRWLDVQLAQEGAGQVCDALRARIQRLDHVHQQQRRRAHWVGVARNLAVGGCLALLLIVLLVQYCREQTDCLYLVIRHGSDPVVRAAVRATLLLVGCAVLVPLLVYVTVYQAVRGYHQWDSTHLHHPAVGPAYLLTCLVPGTVVVTTGAWLARRYLGRRRHAPPPPPRPPIRCLVLPTCTTPPSVDARSLHVALSLLLTSVLCILLLLLQSPFMSVLPVVLHSPGLTAFMWAHQFRTLTVSLQLVPLQLMVVMEHLGTTYPVQWWAATTTIAVHGGPRARIHDLTMCTQ